MIKTSVIIPVYNTEKYVRECLASVFAQSQQEIEVIVINDGSTDNSLAILQEIKKEHPKMVIYSQSNQGLGSARNKGLELAQGEYIYFLDSDDYILPDTLEVCYDYVSKYQLDFVTFDTEEFGDIEKKNSFYDRAGIIDKPYEVMTGVAFANRYWRKSFYPMAWAVYCSREFLQRNLIQFMPRVYFEDNEFYCRIVSLAERMMYLPLMLHRYRRFTDGSSITASGYSKRKALDMLEVVAAIASMNLPREMKRICKEVLVAITRGVYRNCEANDLLQQPEVAERLTQIQRSLLQPVFSKLLLSQYGYKVAIYGSGKDAALFLKEYQDVMGNIQAELVFIDSYKQTGTAKMEGFNIYNVSDLQALSLDCIIIASSKYEDEIYQQVCKIYRGTIICLRRDLGI